MKKNHKFYMGWVIQGLFSNWDNFMIHDGVVPPIKAFRKLQEMESPMEMRMFFSFDTRKYN